MSDFYSEDLPTNAYEFTVSELSHTLKRSVEDQFGHVRVRGELSGVKRAASGHLYLGLKDDQSVMDGVCWSGTAAKLSFIPEDGLEVICTGKLTTYPARSKYQLVISHMEPAGAGALMALLEERKKKLTAEGLFSPDHKKPLPFLPRVIGVVTSPTGAVIRDILHRLSDRFPVHVLVWPVLVQGEGAAAQVTKAIKGFNALAPGGAVPRPDLIIVARGGGSIEDLWPFNEENVVRAAFESDIPLMSAVGHETDTTLIDYASDKRAPTPTGAAEMAVPVRADLLATLYDLDRRLEGQKSRMITDRQDKLRALARALPKPQDLTAIWAQRLDDLGDRLPRGLKSRVQEAGVRLARLSGGLVPLRLKDRIDHESERLDGFFVRLKPAFERGHVRLTEQLLARTRMLQSLSYKKVLERGYVLVSAMDGRPVTEAAQISAGDHLSLTFSDGRVEAVARGEGNGGDALKQSEKPQSHTPVKKPVKKPVKRQKPSLGGASGGQGNLF